MQRKFLENKGLVNQFTKMDVKKFKELTKFTLATHADWAKWNKGLFEMSQDYARIPALWHVAYERLWILEGIRPPPWIRDWLDTAMDPGLLTKDKAEVYRLAEAKLAELAGKMTMKGAKRSRQRQRQRRQPRCRPRLNTCWCSHPARLAQP